MPREGRLPRLTPARRERLINSVTAGNPIKAAAETADLGYTTVKRYRARGRAAQAALDLYLDSLPEPRRRVLDRMTDERLHAHLEHRVPPTERVYWNLEVDLTRAEALASEVRVARLAKTGAGFYVDETTEIVREVLVDDPAANNGAGGKVVNVLTERRTVRRWMYDWRADLEWLRARDRENWGRSHRIDVAGVEDHPIVVESVEQKVERGLAIVRDIAEGKRQQERLDADVTVPEADGLPPAGVG